MQDPSPPPERLITCMRIVISAVAMAVAVWVLVSQNYPEDYNKWAFGTIGLVLGYWLR